MPFVMVDAISALHVLERFFDYEAIVRGIYHNELHDFIGGTMSGYHY